MEDELIIGDAVVNKNKTSSFTLMNSSDHVMKFNWNQGDKDEFRFYPQVGHIQGHTTKQIKVVFKSDKTVKYDKIDLVCETQQIDQKPVEGESGFKDWDDTMKTMVMVRPSEYKKIMQERQIAERKRKEEAEAAAAAAATKGKGKPPAKTAKKDDGP